METSLKPKDFVRVVDGSWAVCVSKEWNEGNMFNIMNPVIGQSPDIFEVLYVIGVWDNMRIPHDIYIQNIRTKEVFLHSSNLVRKVKRAFSKEEAQTKTFAELKENVVSHWERMIAWVKDNKEKGWEIFYKDDLLNHIGENASVDFCAFCMAFYKKGEANPCASCPLAQQFYPCSDERSNYPGRYGYIHQWLFEAKLFLEKIKRLEKPKTKEELYQPLHMGDRVTIDIYYKGPTTYIISQTSYGSYTLIDIEGGNRYSAPVTSEPDISLDTFKQLLGSRADNWYEIYKTVQRAKTKA